MESQWVVLCKWDCKRDRTFMESLWVVLCKWVRTCIESQWVVLCKCKRTCIESPWVVLCTWVRTCRERPLTFKSCFLWETFPFTSRHWSTDQRPLSCKWAALSETFPFVTCERAKACSAPFPCSVCVGTWGRLTPGILTNRVWKGVSLLMGIPNPVFLWPETVVFCCWCSLLSSEIWWCFPGFTFRSMVSRRSWWRGE